MSADTEGDRLSNIRRGPLMHQCPGCFGTAMTTPPEGGWIECDCGEKMDVIDLRAPQPPGAVSGTPEGRIADVLHSIGFGAERHDLARRMLKLAQDAHAGGRKANRKEAPQ